MMRDHGLNAHPVIISAVAPTKTVYPNLIPGYLWLDTTVPALKRCTDADAPTYVNVETNLGAPTNADYLVGTANGDLSAEIVVGTTPGGELGGTWAAPTVDTTHSGSSHANLPAGAQVNTVDIVTVSGVQTFITNIKTFMSGLLAIRNPADTFKYIINGGAIVADRTVTLPLLTGNDVLVTEAMTQTLTNKTLTSPTLTTPALGTPASGVMTNVTGLPTAGMVDDAVTLAKMAAGTAGNLITYDASGNPAAVATGTAAQVLTSNGAGAAPTMQTASSGTSAIKSRFASSFETAARFIGAASGGGTVTFSNEGADINSSATASSGYKLQYSTPGSATIKLYDGSPVFSCIVSIINVGASMQTYLGLGWIATAGSGHTFTNAHIGFKTIANALHVTQGDDTTENASSSLSTLSADDRLDLVVVVNSTTSADYYFRKNGTALSSATNLTTNRPTGNANGMQFSTDNIDIAGLARMKVGSMSYER